jgi:hypothetical protein
MHDGTERLAKDLEALAAMSSHMAEYLDSDVLFWPLASTKLPKLTLGGYLMREHRLQNLHMLLSPEQNAEVGSAVSRFNEALAERIVRFEAKAHSELEARLRQWEEVLKDMDRETFDHSSNYGTAVETRAMIQALIDRLSMPPYRAEARPGQHLAALDTRLRNRWQPGDFVWPEAWTSAYPPAEYWWLYGLPRTRNDRH